MMSADATPRLTVSGSPRISPAAPTPMSGVTNPNAESCAAGYFLSNQIHSA
jgi:hypothetical protein